MSHSSYTGLQTLFKPAWPSPVRVDWFVQWKLRNEILFSLFSGSKKRFAHTREEFGQKTVTSFRIQAEKRDRTLSRLQNAEVFHLTRRWTSALHWRSNVVVCSQSFFIQIYLNFLFYFIFIFHLLPVRSVFDPPVIRFDPRLSADFVLGEIKCVCFQTCTELQRSSRRIQHVKLVVW